MSGEAVFEAAGRDWAFKLTINQWMRLQSAFGGLGPFKVSERLQGQDWTITDLRELIERALEGGGMPISEAKASATEIIDGQPLIKSYELVHDIITAAFAGLDEVLKKKEATKALRESLSRIARGDGNGTSFLDTESLLESSLPNPKPSSSESTSA